MRCQVCGGPVEEGANGALMHSDLGAMWTDLTAEEAAALARQKNGERVMFATYHSAKVGPRRRAHAAPRAPSVSVSAPQVVIDPANLVPGAFVWGVPA